VIDSALALLRARALRAQDLLEDVCMMPGGYLSNVATHEVAGGHAQNTTTSILLLFLEKERV